MAGIAGIIPKTHQCKKVDLVQALERMIKKLAYSEIQMNQSFSNEHCYAGNVVPINSVKNDHYIAPANLPYYVFVDGMVFVSNKEKSILDDKYKQVKLQNDYEYIPLLFDYYGDKFVNHITGWYNIFVYDEQNQKHLLVNDRLGYLSLYYYESEECFIFASKIESILASGLMKKIEFDEVTLAEHLLFNYPLSDNTYLKHIFTLPDASILSYDKFGVTIQRYWDINELFNIKQSNKKQSLQIINNALNQSIEKLFENKEDKINFSLTGGWDSRVVLSYLLPDRKVQINTYSFGGPDADDIKVPELIAQNEGFSYTPYILNQQYLENFFLENAIDTIKLSNGTRNYKRTHYMYAIKQIAQKSNTLLTGIFGDEVFKVGKPQGGTVISKNAIDFIESDFDVNLMLNKFQESNLANLLDFPKDYLIREFEHRLKKIKDRFDKYETTGQQYFAFRFTLNLRKYFGHEVNSYNDFVYCFSPFIDYDFLKEFARTKYMGSRFLFKRNNIIYKYRSTKLYYKIIKQNKISLTYYNSSRGYPIKDISTISGIIKIAFLELFLKKFRKSNDMFNTSNVTNLFINNTKHYSNNINNNKLIESINLEDYYSILFWYNSIKENLC